jgi:hypothetical protein
MANCKKCHHTIYWLEEGKKQDGSPRWVPCEDVALTQRHECNAEAPVIHATEAANDIAVRAHAMEATSGISLLRIDQKLDHIIEMLEAGGVQL